jgi:hypothetical protein
MLNLHVFERYLYIKNSEIYNFKYYTKTIKKWLPKYLPFYLTLRRLGIEQFDAFKLFWIIVLYVSDLPVNFQ